MNFHKQLQKQIQEYLPSSLQEDNAVARFLTAVNNTYQAFDSFEKAASKHDCTEADEIREQLAIEREEKKILADKLKKSLDNNTGIEEIDLLQIAERLSKEVTQHKQAEKTLLSLIANIQIGVLMEDETGTILYANRLFCSLFNLPSTAEQLVGGKRSEKAEEKKYLFPDPDAFVADIVKIQQQKKLVTGEVLELINGKVYERNYIPIFTEGEYKGNLWTYTDITEKKKSQDTIRKMLEKLGDTVWEYDLSTRQIYFPKSETKTAGYTIASGDIELWVSQIITEDRLQLEVVGRDYRAGLIDNHSIEYRLTDAKGCTRWILDRGFAVDRDAIGTPVKILGIHTEITKSKETEQALRESEQRFRQIAENIPGVLYTYHSKNGRGSFSYISSGCESKIGINEEQLKNYYGILHPDDYRREKEARKFARHHNIPYKFEGRFVVPGKPAIWLSISSSVTKINIDGTFVYTGIITNITKEKEAEVALQMREEKYRSIIANMNLGLMEVDNDDVIQFVNNSFCEMSGYDEEELLGNKAGDFFLTEETARVMNEKNKMRENGYSDVYEMSLNNKKGQRKWWLISGAPRLNDKGNMIGTIGIHLDITKQKLLQEELLIAKKQAEESAKSRQIFLANMSHEIRTPMNAIIGMSNQLSKTVLNQSQRLFLDTISSAANNLLIVINDILDLSKMEAGKLNLESIGFNLPDVINRSFNVIAHKAEEKGLSLHIAPFDSHISNVLLGDPYRINQVLLNLLSNSVKFTETGSITISSRLVKDLTYSQVISIVVEDTGVGMETEYLERIFEAFNQEYNSVTRKFGGTGLGMNICKQLVEMMGGTIDVKSEKGKGTKVEFTIEYAKGYSSDIVSKDIKDFEAEKLKDRKILVADDNSMNRFLITVIFQNYGSIIREAKNGQEAIDMLKEEDFDLVLMDIQMPIVDGVKATRIIRNELNSQIPIIALTANAIKGDQDAYLQAGMNSYVLKPFNEDDLLRTVINWIYHRDEKNSIMREESIHQDKLYNLSQLLEIGSGDDTFVTHMIVLFIKQAQLFMKEMSEAREEKDLERMAAVLHKVKPSISSICKPFMYSDVKHLEHLALEGESLEKINTLADGFLRNICKLIEQLEKELPAEVELS